MFKFRHSLSQESTRNRVRRTSPALVIVALLALTSLVCQCSPRAASPSNPYSVGSLSEAEALQALDGANRAFQDSFDSNGVPDMLQLLDYLKGNPAFQAFGPSPDGSVWAYLTNGRLAIFIPPVQDAPQSSARPAAGLAAPLRVRAAGGPDTDPALPVGGALAPVHQGSQTLDLPSNDLVLIMNGLPWGRGYTFDDVKLALWFTNQKYKVTIQENGIQVDDLYLKDKGIDYGVFIIGTHGGLACARPVNDACSEWVTVLATNTSATSDNDKRYADDLDHHRLAYVGSHDQPGNFYAFTGSFITTHMHFADDSLVFLAACSGINLAAAFAEANASVVVGWDNPQASDIQNYFFDRLLGINQEIGPRRTSRPEPPNRPFDYQSVYSVIQESGFDTYPVEQDVYAETPGGGYQIVGQIEVDAKFLSVQAGGSFGILRPTIERLEVDEENGKLIIVGKFGSEEGQVFINGTQLNATWDSERIEAELPDAKGPNGTGLVLVKVRDHKSNEVPLTRWHVKFTYIEGPDQTTNATQQLDLDIYWRADIHQIRTIPDRTPQGQSDVQLTPADASSATWSCQWSGSFGGFTFTTDSGEGPLALTRDEEATGFFSTATMDGKLRQILNLQFVVNYDPETTCKVTTTGGGVSDTSAIGFVYLPSIMQNVGDNPALDPLSLGDHYELTGENRDLNNDEQWPYLKWGTTPGENYPDDKKTDG